MPCPTALPSAFRTYVHKMTFRSKSRVLSSYWFLLWLYHFSVKTILLESSVTLSHICFDDFPSYLQATFVRVIIDSKDPPSLPPFPVCHPSSCSSFFPSFSATRHSWRRKKTLLDWASISLSWYRFLCKLCMVFKKEPYPDSVLVRLTDFL